MWVSFLYLSCFKIYQHVSSLIVKYFFSDVSLLTVNFFFLPFLITGRRSGASITLVTRGDWRKAADLIPILERAGQVLCSLSHTQPNTHTDSIHIV